MLISYTKISRPNSKREKNGTNRQTQQPSNRRTQEDFSEWYIQREYRSSSDFSKDVQGGLMV